MENDIAETMNFADTSWGRVTADRLDKEIKIWTKQIEQRESRTNKGANGKC